MKEIMINWNYYSFWWDSKVTVKHPFEDLGIVLISVALGTTNFYFGNDRTCQQGTSFTEYLKILQCQSPLG